MFVNVNRRKNQLDGTSFYNLSEIEDVVEFMKHAINWILKNEHFRPYDITIITPYAAQRRRLKEELTKIRCAGGKTYDFSRQVLSVD